MLKMYPGGQQPRMVSFTTFCFCNHSSITQWPLTSIPNSALQPQKTGMWMPESAITVETKREGTEWERRSKQGSPRETGEREDSHGTGETSKVLENREGRKKTAGGGGQKKAS